MQRSDSLYMDSRWRAAGDGATFMVVNPAIGEHSDQLASAPERDVDAAALPQCGSLGSR